MGDAPTRVVIGGYKTHYFYLPSPEDGEPDIVPVRILQKPNGQPFVLTMFKCFALFVWLDPLIVKGRPVVLFANNLHAVISRASAYPAVGSGFGYLDLEDLSRINVQLSFLKKLHGKETKLHEGGNLKGYNGSQGPRRVSIEHTFDISKCKCYTIVGSDQKLEPFATSSHFADRSIVDNVVLAKLTGIARSLMAINRKQQVLKESIDEVGERIREVKTVLDSVAYEIKKDPKRIAAALERRSDEMKTILLEISKQLKDLDPQRAEMAKRLYDRVWQRVSRAADLLQILGFITGVTTARSLLNSSLVQRIIDFLKDVLGSLG